jgi:hypothetical protein
MDALPALLIGGLLSVLLIRHGLYDLLFGTWMALYGLAHVPFRLSLPPANYGIGIYYMICGAVCLVAPGISFLDPWPMGIVFFGGEWIGGYVLHQMNRQYLVANTTAARGPRGNAGEEGHDGQEG